MDKTLIIDFFTTIPKAMWTIRRHIRKASASALTLPEFRVLAHLTGGFKTNNELAELQGIDITTMTRLLDPLERRGLITRVQSQEDRRRIQISLTETGKKLFLKIQRKAAMGLIPVFSILTKDENNQMLNGFKVLEKLVLEDSRIEKHKKR